MPNCCSRTLAAIAAVSGAAQSWDSSVNASMVRRTSSLSRFELIILTSSWRVWSPRFETARQWLIRWLRAVLRWSLKTGTRL